MYHEEYIGYLRSTIADVFKVDELAKEYDGWAQLLRPYAEKASSAQAFDAAVTQLKAFATQRVATVEAFLAPIGLSALPPEAPNARYTVCDVCSGHLDLAACTELAAPSGVRRRLVRGDQKS